MAELKFQEKQTIDQLLDMGEGYVSDFSNRTFQMFIGDFNIDIYDDKYADYGNSKAKRLRCLNEKENNFVVAEILESLLEHQMAVDIDPGLYAVRPKGKRETLYQQTRNIIFRLKGKSKVENVSSIKTVTGDEAFTLLAESVRKSIEDNKPVEALDGLHTYMIKYSKKLCDKYSIYYTEDHPLHSIFGSYVRNIKEKDIVESNMTLKILGSYVKMLDTYNGVRNNESLAHDNDIINDNGALLILNCIANLVRFVDELERR